MEEEEMALLKDYKGDEDADPGRWFPYKQDPETGQMAELLLRRCPPAVASRISKSFEELVVVEVGKKKERRLMIPPEKQPEAGIEIFLWSLLDVRNFEVRAMTRAAAEVYSAELGRTVAVGETVRLDGKLTKALKRYVLEELQDMAPLVNEVALGRESQVLTEVLSQEEQARGREEALRGNLPSGSSSSSGGTARPEAAPAASTAAPSAEATASPA